MRTYINFEGGAHAEKKNGILSSKSSKKCLKMTFLAFFSKFYRLNNQICLTHFLAFLFDIGLVKLYFIKILFKKTFPMPVKGQSEHSGLPWLSAVWFILRLVFQLSILLTLLKKWQGSFCLICEQNSRSKTTLYVYCQPNLRKIVSIFPVFFFVFFWII